METSPNIPDKIIKSFKTEFKHIDNNTELPKIIKPEICDALVSTELSRNPWSSDENKHKKAIQMISKEKQNIDSVLTFKRTFYDINNRDALESEIIDNLKDKIDMTLLVKTIDQIKKNEDNSSSSLQQTNKDNNV